MPYQPLTEAQFNKAINAGYSPQEITQFELQRKKEIETLETPKAKKTLGGAIMGAANAVTDFVGARGIADQFGADIARARAPQEQKGLVQYPTQKQVMGSAVQTGSLLIPGSLGAKAAARIGGTGLTAGSARLGAKVGAGAATGYGLDVGAGLQAGEGVGESFKPGLGTAIGGAIPVAGGLFNLAKSGVKKVAPTALEFTSGVPKSAIETAMKSPAAAKTGRTSSSLEEIRNLSAEELKKLYTQLSQEFDTGLEKIKAADRTTRAAAANTGTRLYHATNKKFDKFNPAANPEDYGTWFSREKIVNPNYPIIKEATLKPGTRLITEAQLSKLMDKKDFIDDPRPFHEALIKRGYSGIDYGDSVQLFRPNEDTIGELAGKAVSGVESASTRKELFEYAKRFGREFRLGFKKSANGTTVDFSKSPIVKGGEQNNVQEAINTIAGWEDFSARGMQDLAERVGALRKFESGAKTESSAILGKIYHKLTRDLIGKNYPELATLRTNYGKNRRTLDAIDDLFKIDKKNPVAVQSSINRLKQVFNEDKDTYLKLVKELSDRSGVDILGMLAGEQFQKVLPSFVRGLGGGAVVSVGASVVNPWLALLAPLFSPRGVGKIVEKGVQGSPTLRAAASAARKVAPLVGATTGAGRQEP